MSDPADSPLISSEKFDAQSLAFDGQAFSYYEKHGAETVEHAFAIANILHIHARVLEASSFYRRAFDLHSKSQTEFPLPQSLLQVRLLCLLKAGLEANTQEIYELEKYSVPMANYIRGISAAWRSGDTEGSLKLIGNAFEEFHSGEEIDRLYLEIALRWLRSFGSIDFPSNEKEIPHHLYMYWDNNPPEEIRNNIEFHKKIIGDNFTIFDQQSAAAWLYDYYGKDASELFLKVRHPAEGADILRLHVIMANGGWWLDADLKIRSPEAWANLAGSKAGCQLFTTDNFVLHNDFFGAAPSDPVITNAMMTAWANMFIHPHLYIAFKTGPGVLNRAVSRALFQSIRQNVTLPALRIDNQSTFDMYAEEYEVAYKSGGNSWHNQ